jgi:tripartite-type tricarboxylate transporter receptor subunit TctC
MLRHSTGYKLANDGHDTRAIQDYLGHRSIASTVRYTTLAPAPAVTDLIGGRVQVVFDNFAASIEFVRAGKLRALAVTTATRSPPLPDVPSLGDFLPGYDASTWLGIGAPKNTPPDIVEKLNKEINAVLADPSMEARIANFGYTAFASSSAEFGKFIAEDIQKWAKVVKFAGIRPD